MRVITGTARGRKLNTLEGRDVRPTTDQVKEAMFSIIQFEVEGAAVLDLFAGSGSLGLEALSRGAAYAYFCDRDRGAQQAVNRNIANLGLQEQAQLFPVSYEAAIAMLAQRGVQVELVFLDPPYAGGLYENAFSLLLQSGILAPGCILAAEHSPKASLPVPPGLCAYDTRRYGDVAITFLREAQP